MKCIQSKMEVLSEDTVLQIISIGETVETFKGPLQREAATAKVNDQRAALVKMVLISELRLRMAIK